MVLRLIISALAVGLTAWLLPGVTISSMWWTIGIAIVLGLINVLVRPLVDFLSLPANILTLGLFTFVIDALMVLLGSWLLGSHFVVDGFWWALLFSIVLSIVTSILDSFLGRKKA